MSESNDFLMNGGSDRERHPSAKWPTIGSVVAGTVVAIAERPIQQTKKGTNEKLVFADGSPRLMLPVELQTTERDASNPDDTGIRVIFLKFNLRNAVADAVRAAGANGLAVGGQLTITHTAMDGDAKLYSATYVPPAPGNEFLMGDVGPQVSAQGNVSATLGNAGPEPTAAAVAVNPVDTAKSLISLGQPDELVANVTGLTPEVVAAIRNTVAA